MHPDVGVVAAALTPRGKRGELNFGACFELIDYLCKAGVRGIALLTAAGEYPAFTVEERRRLVYLGVKRARVPLLAGVGSEDLETSIELARDAFCAGAAAVLLPPPLLFPYPEPELREYYLQFAAQVEEKGRIWIVPGASLTSEAARELLGSGRFAGMTGRELPIREEACAIPELLVALNCARRTGDEARTAELERAERQFLQWAQQFGPLVAVKVAAEVRGIPSGPLPVPVPPEKRHLLEEFREWFRAWLPMARKIAANA
jgi:dihydrodipicolinate synthase/N-acetylneuraminate lyase